MFRVKYWLSFDSSETVNDHVIQFQPMRHDQRSAGNFRARYVFSYRHTSLFLAFLLSSCMKCGHKARHGVSIRMKDSYCCREESQGEPGTLLSRICCTSPGLFPSGLVVMRKINPQASAIRFCNFQPNKILN